MRGYSVVSCVVFGINLVKLEDQQCMNIAGESKFPVQKNAKKLCIAQSKTTETTRDFQGEERRFERQRSETERQPLYVCVDKFIYSRSTQSETRAETLTKFSHIKTRQDSTSLHNNTRTGQYKEQYKHQ